MAQRERVSLVATVLNEATALDSWLASIEAQSRTPDQVMVVDGGSTDGTLARLEAWAAKSETRRILSYPGSNISQGRNRAIESADCEIIAVTDAGVVLEADWLERLVAALTPDVDVVSGFFAPQASGTFEQAMAATVLPAPEDVDADRFLPSSRSVAFRRAAWEQVGGYPEWLDYCEDLVFDFRLKSAGFRLTFEPQALVHFRPRGTWRSFFLQYYRYARGDGKADLWRLRHAARYAAYLFAAVAIGTRNPLALSALALGAGFYCRRPAERLRARGLQGSAVLEALSLIPLIRLTGDVAKMIGYPVGWVWRMRNRRG